MNHPTVSVITVTYNAVDELKATLDNLSSIDYPEMEVIVIDGGSSDGTKELLAGYGRPVSYWSSERDNGIYDAMNKGLLAAEGEFIWFINAGDFVHDPEVLKKIFYGKRSFADIYYGETLIRSVDGEILGLRKKKLPRNLQWTDFINGMVVCHQSIIVRRDIAPEYDTVYRYASDVEWVLLSLKKAKSIENTGMILSEFTEGGTSTKYKKESLRERFRIMTKHFGIIPTLFAHAKFVICSPQGSKYRPLNK
ncbi:MAG: glycosyltransferase [Rikenellaceae bacterium]|nr:glycosyltransferase [Rikenellaceae bacterium]